jgi:hypothetical protein
VLGLAGSALDMLDALASMVTPVAVFGASA